MQENKKKLDAKKMEEKKTAATKRAAEEAAKKAAKAKAEEGGAQIEEITDEEALALQSGEKPVAKVEEKVEAKKEGDEDKDEDGKDKGAKPNRGNGGECEGYDWEQTLSEITCNVYLPPNVTGKNLSVNMGIKTAKIQIKGGDMLMEGEWCEPIIQDDSLWCIEEVRGKRVL